MSVRNRLVLGVLVLVGVLTLAVGLLLELYGRQVGEVLGRNAQSSAAGMADEIDRALSHQIEGLQELVATASVIHEAVRESAAEVEAAAEEAAGAAAEEAGEDLENQPEDARGVEAGTGVVEILVARDRGWVEGSTEGVVRQAELLGHPVSDRLRRHQTFYRDHYGFELLGEIFLTDRHGANVAQTAITSDYLQSDEAWWQQARQEGLAVGDPRWDESAGVLAVELSVRVEDEGGDFLGVLKAALALDEVLRVVRSSRDDLAMERAAVEVVTGSGERILVDGEESLVPEGELVPERDGGGIIAGAGAGEGLPAAEGYTWLESDPDRPEVLVGWGTSRGYRDFDGTGWTVRLYLDAAEVMGPVRRLRRSLLLVASITLLLALVVTFFLGRGITRPIERAVGAADRLARGDYGFEVEGSAPGELGRLLSGLGAVVEGGRRALRGVVLASGRIGSAARELTAVSREISSGAEKQLGSSHRTSTAMESLATSTEQLADSAQQVSSLVHDVSASIEEMASSNEGVARHSQELARALDRTSGSLGEMAASIEQVAEGAGRARDDSEAAVTEAEEGSLAVERVVGGIGQVSQTLTLGLSVMETLGRTHEEVGQRLRIIDEICAETDLLAVNAAIEAAHAGEHGRTFAVVATDMRRLSERSARAAGEISEVLERVAGDMAQALEVSRTGVREAQEGETLAERAGDALQRIGKAVGDTRERMIEISTATEEQARASAEALQAVEEIRNLSLRVEEATREQAQGSQRIAHSVAGIRDLAEEVSAASGSQNRETERIARALAEVYRVSQEHAETVVQITGISEDLRQQVAELERVAGVFLLTGTEEEGDGPDQPRPRGQEAEAAPEEEAAGGLSPQPAGSPLGSPL